MNKKKAFIFDFDGTIADTLPILINDVYKVNDQMNLIEAEDIDIEEIRQKSTEEFFKELNLGPIKLIRFILKFRKLFNAHSEHVPVINNLEPVLQELNNKDLVLGIVTSNSKSNVRDFLKINELSMFSFIESSFWPFNKDKLLKKVIKKHKIDPKNSYYIGDETRDIRAGKSVGLKTVSVTWGIGMEPVLKRFYPDHIIDRPKELLDIFSEIN